MANPFFRFIHAYPRLIRLTAIAWTLLIFIGCSIPGKELPSIGLFDHADKLIHFIFFFVLVILWALNVNDKSKSKHYILLFSIIYGILLEIYQFMYVSGRSFDVWDIVADTFGALLGFMLIKRIKLA